MDTHQRHHHSHLFTVRLWREDLSDGQTEWRGEVRHVESGETTYFRDWPSLVQSLLARLPQPDADRPSGPPEGAAPP